MRPVETLTPALWYPWDDGAVGVTLFVGGVLTLLSPLVVPGFLVIGYGLSVVEGVMDDTAGPPGFGDWRDLLVAGIKGAIVLLAYVLIPLAIGTVILAAVAGAFGVRFPGGIPSVSGGLALGGLVFALVLLLAGFALVVAYLAPAALVHLARTGRLKAAFNRADVRGLARSAAYGSAWLLAVVVFAANAVVLTVLNAAAVGVVLSGFVSFYAFVAMTYLYAVGAREAGYDLDRDGPTGITVERDPDA